MKKYIFLDNWVLSEYTKKDKINYLINFITNQNFNVLINSFSFVELYNLKIDENNPNDRVSRVCKFLSSIPCTIIDTIELFRTEIFNYPNPVIEIPSKLELNNLNIKFRYQALINFFKRDKIYLDMGKDIKNWFESYQNIKNEWIDNVNSFISDAINKKVLFINEKNDFINLEVSKEICLINLDMRYFYFLNNSERENLGVKIVKLFTEDMNKLKAIHFSSLCFWYKYIDIDKSYTMQKLNSDIGDIFQMSLIPYCEIFTLDKTMYFLSNKIAKELKYSVKLMNKKILDKELGIV